MSGISNFNFANPTRIVFGKGQIAQLPNLIPKDKIVYMTYGGGSIKRNGVYDQVMEALKGYEVRFRHIEEGGVRDPQAGYEPSVPAVCGWWLDLRWNEVHRWSVSVQGL